MLSIKKEQFKNSQDFFRRLDFLHSILLLSPLVLFCVLYLARFRYATRYRHLWLEDWQTLLLAIIPSILIYYYYNKKKAEVLSLLGAKGTLKDKMVIYYQMNVRYFMYILSLFLLVLFVQYFILDPIFNLVFAVVLIIASIEKPTSLRMCKLMKLDKETTDMVYTQKEIIE